MMGAVGEPLLLVDLDIHNRSALRLADLVELPRDLPARRFSPHSLSQPHMGLSHFHSQLQYLSTSDVRCALATPYRTATPDCFALLVAHETHTRPALGSVTITRGPLLVEGCPQGRTRRANAVRQHGAIMSAATLERPRLASSPASWHLVHQACCPDAPCCDADASRQRRS